MPARHRGPGLLLAAGCLLFYLLQGRQALHGYDAFLALQALQAPTLQAPGHFLYFPLARLWWLLVSPLGLDGHTALRALSAVGVASGVWFAQRTALALRLRPGNALGLAAAFGCLPDAVYCAAVVEVDGLLLGMSGAIWCSVVRLARRPSSPRAMLVGLLTGTCAGLHAGGQLLLATAMALYLCQALQRSWRRRYWRPLLRAAVFAAVVVAVHGGLFTLLALLAAHAGQLQMAGNVLLVSQPWDRLPTTLWQEWLVPYAPFAVLWAGALGRRAWRGPAGGFALCLLGYLAFTNAVLGHFEPLGFFAAQERGAFMICIALPTVVLGWLWLPPKARALALLTAVVIAVVDVRTADWEPMPPGFDTDLLQAAQQPPSEVWVGGFEREFGWIRKRVVEVRCYPVPDMPRQIARAEQAGTPVDAAFVVLWFDQRHDALVRDGLTHLLTLDALAWLRTAADPRIRQLAEQHLPAHYTMQPLDHGAFHAVRLTRR